MSLRPAPRAGWLPGWRWLIALSIGGIALGLGSAWLALRASASFGHANGPWRASLLAGSADADLYTRARVAAGGLLALNRGETMYFVAATDSAGRPLRARCAYRIAGTPPPGRWWSLTAYADDHYLFADAQRRYSINGATARLDAAGRFAVATGPEPPAEGTTAWLPTPGDGGLVLTLRVYNPAPTIQADPAALEAPSITPAGNCSEAA
jgi:hypothetical protein